MQTATFNSTNSTSSKSSRPRSIKPANPQRGNKAIGTATNLFDQLDLVAALQTGNYLKGPYAARAADEVFAAIRA